MAHSSRSTYPSPGPNGERPTRRFVFRSRINRASCRYIGKYLLGNDIGRGSFGTVKLAKHKVNGTIVAIKRINDVDDARTRKLVDLEIEMQGRLKHPLIAELYEVMKVDKMVFMVRAEHASEC